MHVGEEDLEPEGKTAQEIVGVKKETNDGPFESKEVNAERSDVVGLCSTDVNVDSMLERYDEAAVREETPRGNHTDGLDSGDSPDGVAGKFLERRSITDGRSGASSASNPGS